MKLLTCINVSDIGLRTKLRLLISGRPLCKPGLHNQALHAKTTRFYESARSAPWREKKPSNPSSPTSNQASMTFSHLHRCVEKGAGVERGEGEETSCHGRRSLSSKKMWRNQNADLGQKARNTRGDCKNVKSTKLKPRKLQLNVMQHTDSTNVLRRGALKDRVTKFKNFTLEPRLAKTNRIAQGKAGVKWQIMLEKTTAYSFPCLLESSSWNKTVQANAPTSKFPKESYSAVVSPLFSPEVQFRAHTQRNCELVDQHFRDQATPPRPRVLNTDLSCGNQNNNH